MISESVLSSVIRTKNYDMVDLCLKNYHKPLVVTQQLVDSFAGFPPRFHLEPRARPDVKSLRRLLQHGTLVHPIHSSSIERILEIFGSGIADELFKITENRLLVDESVLVSIVSTKNVKIIKSFFKRYTDHLTITPRVLIMVLQTDAPSHVEVTTNDEYGEPDETSECNPGWPESDELYDSKSSDHSSVLKPRQYWYAEPQVPNDERDAENLKMNEDTNTAYYTSAYLLEYLLRYCTYDPMGLTKDILLSAVANRECEALFTIIAKYYSLESVRITQNIAQAAASNSKRNVQLLLDWFPGKVPITEDVLIAAARNSKESYETLRLLFSCSSYRISVSKKVMIALLQNPNSCPSAFRLVFEYGGSSLLRSQEIKTSIVRNAGRGSVLQFFLELPGFSLTVTENMVRSNENDGEPLISSSLLFKDRRVRFSPASIAFVMAKGDADSTMSLLEKLATDREDHHLTENVFLHAISNEQERAWFTVHHLLPLISKFLTEKAWIAAAKNKVNGWTLMQMFADYDPTLESMTPTVLLHAARNDLLGNDILKWLLSYHPSKVRFSEGILAAISGNPSWWTGEPLTSEIYRPHIWQNGPILEVILHQAQENAKITENILIAAVKNPTHSARYLRVLLQHPTREVLNLQRVAAIAAAQESVEIKSLLSFFQHGARTNEDIVVAAMRNSQRGGDIFELLRVENLWGDFVATDKVLSAAADNAENGNDLLEDFLRSYQGVIVLQDEHIEKVANSFSLDVMRQLRIRQRFPVSNPLPVFAYSHYLFYVLHRWFVLYC